MLFQLRFRTDSLTLPMAYQTRVQGMLYHLMRSVPDYSAFLHERGYGAGGGSHFKLFCFGRLNGPHQRQNGRLIYPHWAELAVRTADPTLGALLEETLQPGLRCVLGSQTLVLEEVEQETLHLTAPELTIRMDSPISVHLPLTDGKTCPVNPLEEDFSRLVEENYRRKWSAIAGAPPAEPLTITARSVGMQDKCVTRIKGIWVTAWGGTYRLRGTPQALEFLYHTGLGSRNSMGFGLFNILL